MLHEGGDIFVYACEPVRQDTHLFDRSIPLLKFNLDH